MKIGILTFHYSINPGSVIQAYCVYKLLKKSFPHAIVEIINLIPANREDNERQFFGMAPPFLKYRKLLKYQSIRNFIKRKTRLSPHSSEMDLKKQIKFVNSQQYDVIFTGSDTVWMYSEKLNNLLPSIYFLPQELNARKFSISASVDPLINEYKYMEKQGLLLEIFNYYEGLYVRDNVTFDLLKNIGVNQVQKLADPSLLYEFEEDLKIKKDKKKDIQKKVVSIWVTDKEISNYLKNTLSEKFPFLTFIDRKKYVKLLDDHVIEDLNQYHKIDILITDRFHRSIFAMKLSNALVINIERYNKNPISKSKGRDLLTDIGIPEFCLRIEKDNLDSFEKKLFHLIESWDKQKFKFRDHLLEEYIEKNKSVWQNAMDKIKVSQLSSEPLE